MIERYRDGVVPEAQPSTPCSPTDFDGCRARRVCGLLDDAELSQALEVIWALVRRLNRYVEETQPWVLAKDDGRRRASWTRSSTTWSRASRVLTLLLAPYLPQSSEQLLVALGEDSR